MFFEDKPYRPKKGGRRVAIREDGFRRLLAAARGSTRAKRTTTKARVAVPPTGARGRRVVLKARYVSMTHASASRAAEKHLAYVERDGVSKEGGAGVLFGVQAPEHLFVPKRGAQPEHDSPERATLVTPPPTDAQEPDPSSPEERLRQSMLRPIPGEKHQFRVIISAEDAGRLDLTEFIERVMERVERDVGQPLIWAAANHYNTDDPHTHLVIRGVDRNGRLVRFDREYISRVWRERAQEIVTQELGPRTEQEIERQLHREVHRSRYTSLDRSIAQRATSEGVVRSDKLGNAHQRARLQVLQTMGLAEQIDALHWQLREGWQQQLRSDGERDDIIKQMYQSLKDRIDTGRYRIVKRFEPLPGDEQVSGRVVGMGLVDSSPGALFAVVEATNGQGYYIPLWHSEVAELKRGDLVSLQQLKDSWCKPVDAPLEALSRDGKLLTAEVVVGAVKERLREIEQAGLAGQTERGTWLVKPDFRERWTKLLQPADPNPARREAIETLIDLGVQPPGELDLGVISDAVSKRLHELEAIGLASKTDLGHQVAPDLVEGLKQRDKDLPQAHVAVRRQKLSLQAQVTYRGPTWLDTAKLETPCTINDELKRFRGQRETFLERLGIAKDTKDKDRRLVALERDELATRLATQRSRQVAHKLAGFRGRVAEVRELPSGNRYAVIETETELVLVRAGTQARKLVGREVEVAFVVSEYDGRSKLALQPVHDRQKVARPRGR
jgi:type IV secretory pathway VirD2 relaxase